MPMMSEIFIYPITAENRHTAVSPPREIPEWAAEKEGDSLVSNKLREWILSHLHHVVPRVPAFETL